MSEVRPERADALRNRRAILAAIEQLLAEGRPRDISMEQVAATAGVGKGTAELGSAAPARPAKNHPVYRFWHGHINTLMTALRPDADTELIARVMLGSLHSEPILTELADDGPKRLSDAPRALAGAVLDAPTT